MAGLPSQLGPLPCMLREWPVSGRDGQGQMGSQRPRDSGSSSKCRGAGRGQPDSSTWCPSAAGMEMEGKSFH